MHNWPMYAKYDLEAYTYYVGGVGNGMGIYDATAEYPGFPVEVSEDMNTITIKPITVGSGAGAQKLYMNALGVNPADPTSVEVIATVISDIVLTRGWTEPAEKSAASAVSASKVKAMTMDGNVVKNAPAVRRYKSMTKLEVKPHAEYKHDQTPNVVTMDMVQKTSAKYLESEGIVF
jgi:hypothetical protein